MTNAPTGPPQSMQTIMNQMANLPFLIPNPFLFGQQNQPGTSTSTDSQYRRTPPNKKWRKNKNKNKNNKSKVKSTNPRN